MDSTSRIVALAKTIAQNTQVIDEYIVQNAKPALSFEPDGSAATLMSPEIALSRQSVLDATNELHALLLGPVGILTSPTVNHTYWIGLHAIYKFKLATCLKDRATFAEIGAASGLPVDMVRRILRQAMSYHIFCEPEEGVVAHTATSKLLAENSLMTEWVGLVTEEMWPAATKTVDALLRWPKSEEPNNSGFNLAHSANDTFFDEIARDLTRQSRYNAAMTWFNTGPGFEPHHVAKTYPWAENGHNALLVDIGGSTGSVSIALAQHYPSMKFIVQDQSEVVEQGRSNAPVDLGDRVQFMVHNFFETQPVHGADFYFFRWIFHDWSDTYATRILKALIPALKPRAKVLINEFIMPEWHAISAYKEQTMRSFDLAMMELHNGKERGLKDWRELLLKVDARFKIMRVHQPVGARLGLLEIEWSEEGMQEQ